MRILIAANGAPPSVELLRKQHATADLLIATDGAATYVHDAGLTADIVIGDFDSLDLRSPAAASARKLVPAHNQSANDLEKACKLAISRGATHIDLLGALGNRLDQSLTTLSVMLKFTDQSTITAYTDNELVCWVVRTRTFAGLPGDPISLTCMGSPASVSITGVKWPLCDFELTTGSLGVSNVMAEYKVEVTATQGAVLVTHTSR